MIVCICRRLNEHAVLEAVSAGARSPEAVQAYHGCRFNCGKCRCAMKDVISTQADQNQIKTELVAAE